MIYVNYVLNSISGKCCKEKYLLLDQHIYSEKKKEKLWADGFFISMWKLWSKSDSYVPEYWITQALRHSSVSKQATSFCVPGDIANYWDMVYFVATFLSLSFVAGFLSLSESSPLTKCVLCMRFELLFWWWWWWCFVLFCFPVIAVDPIKKAYLPTSLDSLLYH